MLELYRLDRELEKMETALFKLGDMRCNDPPRDIAKDG
jgi:hypothetical protein